MNLSATINFSLLCIEYISISLSCNHDIIDLLQNLLPLSNHVLFGLQLNSSDIWCKELVIIIPFLSFKEKTHAKLL